MKHSFGRVYRSKTWGKKRMGVRVTSNKKPHIGEKNLNLPPSQNLSEKTI